MALEVGSCWQISISAVPGVLASSTHEELMMPLGLSVAPYAYDHWFQQVQRMQHLRVPSCGIIRFIGITSGHNMIYCVVAMLSFFPLPSSLAVVISGHPESLQ